MDSHPKDFLVGTRLPSGAEKALALNPGGIGFFRGTRFAAIDRSNLHINWDDRFPFRLLSELVPQPGHTEAKGNSRG